MQANDCDALRRVVLLLLGAGALMLGIGFGLIGWFLVWLGLPPFLGLCVALFLAISFYTWFCRAVDKDRRG